jgi:pilus assembly protein CpaF
VNIVVQCARLAGGARRVTAISEVTGVVGDVINMHDIFTFEQTGRDAEQRATGHFAATGIRPACLDVLRTCGLDLSPAMFEQRRLDFDRCDGFSQASRQRRGAG